MAQSKTISNPATAQLSELLSSGLYGRQSELGVLESILSAVREETGNTTSIPSEQNATAKSADPKRPTVPSEQANKHQKFVFISGKSGTGKSTLVDAAIQSQTISDQSDLMPNIIFGKGKFEQTLNDARPFAALRSCISDLCETFTEFRNKEEGTFYANRVNDALDHDSMAVLNGFVPNLHEFLAQGDHLPKAVQAASQESLETLKYALRTFLVAIACPERPLVLCLDDLQWIDVPSLKILDAMLKNSALKHFVFIGTYREDEVSSDHSLSVWMETLSNATQISIMGLSLETLVTMLQDAFHAHSVGTSDSDTYQVAIRDLATVLHCRTDGNVFHILQLLDYMQAEKLLTYSISTFKWTWDIEAVKDGTSLSDNLVGVVMTKLKRLTKRSRETVLICSLIGFRFDMTTLEAAVNGLSGTFSVTCDDLDRIVESLIVEGILSKAKGRIKFAHDKVYQAAIELQENAAKLHYLIGKSVQSSSSKNWSLERKLFLSVDQLNLGREYVVESRERLELARLNFLACKRACGLSAFFRASKHVEISIQLLEGSSHWNTEYKLSLELFSIKAELGYILGDTPQVEEATREVVKHARAYIDKTRVFVVSLKSKFCQARSEEALEETVEALRGFGIHFPKEAVHNSNEAKYAALKKRIESMPSSDLLSLPLMKNKEVNGAAHVLTAVWDSIANTDATLGELVILTLVDLSLSHGWSSVGSFCLARLATIAANMNDRSFALLLQQLSSDLMRKPGMSQGKASVLIAHVPIVYWTKALPQLTDGALEAYTVAMRTGDIRTAMLSMVIYTSIYFYSGLPLAPVLADLQRLLSVMIDYRQDMMLLMTLPFFQCISNLVGNEESILNLETGLLKEHRERVSWKEGGVGQETVHSLQMQMAFYCEEYKLASELAMKLKEKGDVTFKSIWLGQVRIFFYCLIAIWEWRTETRLNLRGHRARTRIMKEAKDHYDFIRDVVVEQKNLNVTHKLLILDAELMSTQKSITMEELKVAYDRAIVAATRAGFVQDAALAAHLASNAMANESSWYWERASELYRMWGAHAVVSYVEKKCSRSSRSLLIGGGKSSFMRGQQRYNTSLVMEHQKTEVEFYDADS